jgi:hypothetical protein
VPELALGFPVRFEYPELDSVGDVADFLSVLGTNQTVFECASDPRVASCRVNYIGTNYQRKKFIESVKMIYTTEAPAAIIMPLRVLCFALFYRCLFYW